MSQIALVTGASRGIGKAIALTLAKQGHTVLGTATTESNAAGITDYLAEQGLKGQGYLMNVSSLESIDTAFSRMMTDYGSPAILVNNAAITRDNLMLRMKEEEWDAVITTNLTSVYRLSKLCLKGMLKARFGRIVNLTSVVGCTGNPGQANYAAAKAGVIGFSKSLAIEVASREVTVNCIAPGFIETDMTKAIDPKYQEVLLSKIPMGRMGQPDEIAHAVSFLVSPLAGYITGETLHVNGGMFMS